MLNLSERFSTRKFAARDSTGWNACASKWTSFVVSGWWLFSSLSCAVGLADWLCLAPLNRAFKSPPNRILTLHAFRLRTLSKISNVTWRARWAMFNFTLTHIFGFDPSALPARTAHFGSRYLPLHRIDFLPFHWVSQLQEQSLTAVQVYSELYLPEKWKAFVEKPPRHYCTAYIGQRCFGKWTAETTNKQTKSTGRLFFFLEDTPYTTHSERDCPNMEAIRNSIIVVRLLLWFEGSIKFNELLLLVILWSVSWWVSR